MDDEDSKIRRNLIAVSVVILVSAFLELPVNGLLETIIKGQLGGSPIPQSKFWAIGLALLAYFTFRYKFSEEGLKLAESVKVSFGDEVLKLIVSAVASAEKTFNRTKNFPKLIAAIAPELEEQRKKYSDLFPVARLDSTLHLRYVGDASLKDSRITWDSDWRDLDGGPGRSTSGGYIPLVLPLRLAQWITVRATVMTFVYSKTAIQYIAPLLLASCAIVVLWCRVIAQYAQ